MIEMSSFKYLTDAGLNYNPIHRYKLVASTTNPVQYVFLLKHQKITFKIFAVTI